MLDLKQLRNNSKNIERKLQTKVPEANLSKALEQEQSLRAVKSKLEELQAERNLISKQVGEAKRSGADASPILEKMGALKQEIQTLEIEVRELQQSLNKELACLPNIPMDDIKESLDPEENVIIKTWSEKKTFDFPIKNHVELNEKLNLFDFERGSKISGAGWPVYRQWGARLEWALINYMMSIHIKNGFMQWMPPLLVRREMMYGSGQIPKFEGQFYTLKDNQYDLYLLPTSEVALNGLHYDEILNESQLPAKYFAYTPCFRREAGGAGSQERGLIRMHQFNKVEMFAFSKPEDSMQIFEEMVLSAEEILQGLGLHYRNSLLVTGDMSFCAARTVDIEAWLPGQNRYYEVSSVSNCTDFQSRRSKTRYKTSSGENQLVHTLNGSGLATSRLMVSLLENNQQADGSITIPKVLQPYLEGLEILTP
jgi:seryl-tRNA synthetase